MKRKEKLNVSVKRSKKKTKKNDSKNEIHEPQWKTLGRSELFSEYVSMDNITSKTSTVFDSIDFEAHTNGMLIVCENEKKREKWEEIVQNKYIPFTKHVDEVILFHDEGVKYVFLALKEDIYRGACTGWSEWYPSVKKFSWRAVGFDDYDMICCHFEEIFERRNFRVEDLVKSQSFFKIENKKTELDCLTRITLKATDILNTSSRYPGSSNASNSRVCSLHEQSRLEGPVECCSVCWEDGASLVTDCGHCYCKECATRLLDADLVDMGHFDILPSCSICRKEMARLMTLPLKNETDEELNRRVFGDLCEILKLIQKCVEIYVYYGSSFDTRCCEFFESPNVFRVLSNHIEKAFERRGEIECEPVRCVFYLTDDQDRNVERNIRYHTRNFKQGENIKIAVVQILHDC